MAFSTAMPEPSSERDSEKNPTPYKQTKGGYARLAQFMSDVPDAAVFHRFADLSVQSLLHYQSQLQDLRQELQSVQEEDQEAGGHTEQGTYAFNSSNLRASENNNAQSRDEACLRKSKQWMLLREIRSLLQEYYSALALHYQIVNMKKPQRRQMTQLQKWMKRPTRGNLFLTGDDTDIWDTTKLDELLTMEPLNPDGTTSSRWTVSIVEIYHRVIGRHVHKSETSEQHRNSVLYSGEGIFQVVRGGKALTASMLPIVSVVILYFVKDEGLRLGLIAAFTFIFSLTLCIFTSASIKDIFSATAAFSAVLVVFVGTTLGA